MNIPTTAEVLTKLRAGEAPPVSAMRVFGAPVVLAEEGNAPDAKTIKVKLQARQRGPINHWYWGTVWHDLSTMRHRSKIALDDTHDVEVGYGRPVMSDYGLEVEGVVVTNPDNPQHPANRIAYNLRNGIPQEASIDFGGDYDVEEIPAGMSATINGMEAKGPALVVKNWPLRACAICKEGADSSTQTETLSAAGTAALPRSITTFSMNTPQLISAEPQGVDANPTQPAAEAAPVALAVEAAAVATQNQPDPVDALQAVAVELEQAKKDIASRDAEIAELKSRIAVLTAGAPPVPPTPPESGPQTWGAALKLVQSEHPLWTEWQVHAEAVKRFAGLAAKLNRKE